MKHISLILILLQASLVFGQTSVTAPSGTTFTKSSSDTRAHGLTTAGQTYTISNPSWSQYDTCYYWGLSSSIPGVINAANAAPPGNVCSGMSSITFNSGLSNLTAGVLVYTGTTNYRYRSGFGFTSTTVPTRVTYKVSTTGGVPIALSTSGTLNYLRVTSNFRVNVLVEARHPSSSTYYPAIYLYNILSTDQNYSICTSVDVDQFYSVTTNVDATNFGPYCSDDSIRLEASGSSGTYQWTGPSSFVSTASDTTFKNTGFTNGSEFEVTATGTLGCQDTTKTIVVIRDTASKIAISGNSNPISNGASTSSTLNGTNFGTTGVGGNIPKTFTISNTGTDTLNVGQIVTSSGGGNDFAISGITLPAIIAPSTSNTFVVTFSPTSGGIKQDTLKLSSNSCSDYLYTFLVEGGTGTCDSSNPLASSPGLHVASTAQTSTSGWTCYCNASNELLLSLKLGGTGAVIPTAGVTLKIGSTLAEHHPKNTGFIRNDLGFTVWNRTWDVQPSTQPTSFVPVRYFYSTAMYDSINFSLVGNALAPLPNPDSLYFWKVTNASLGSHPSIGSIDTSDIKLIKGGASTATDTTWVRGINPTNEYAEFLVSGFSGGGGAGGGSLGGTPLTQHFKNLVATVQQGNIILNWEFFETQRPTKYKIYRKESGGTFELIGSMMGANNPFTLIQYSYLDKKVEEGNSYYYQISAELINGDSKWSNMAYVDYFKSHTVINTYPNPMANTLFVTTNGDGSEAFSMVIMSIEGQRLLSFETLEQETSIDVSKLTEGLYILKVQNQIGEMVYSSLIIKE